MKKLFLLSAACMAISLSACSLDSMPAQSVSTINPTPESSIASVSPKSEESNIVVTSTDNQHLIDEWRVFTITVTNTSSQYLTGEITAEMLNEIGKSIGHTSMFVNNLGPDDMEIGTLLCAISDSTKFEYSIVSYEFSDTPKKTPEINDDNVMKYIRMTHQDYDDFMFERRSITTDIHNLTSHHFTGTVTVVAKDPAGNILDSSEKHIENLGPYGSTAIVLGLKNSENPDYTLEYSVANYEFN